jgi:diphthamide synthase (EF-2-diphthine--ammonia ligase)
MHGVRPHAGPTGTGCGTPVDKIELDANESQEGYDAKMQAVCHYRARGIGTVVFGDLFLQDVRQYREKNLAGVNMRAVFPLWERDTRDLAKTFIQTGFRAVITCVNLEVLPITFAGRDYDASFLADLPPGVDPCGERGEFHSFVYDGPCSTPHPVRRGCIVTRENRFGVP